MRKKKDSAEVTELRQDFILEQDRNLLLGRELCAMSQKYRQLEIYSCALAIVALAYYILERRAD